MNQDTYNAPPVTPEKPKGRNTLVIVIIVLLVLCCLCAIAIGLAWQFGDAVMQTLGITY
jgi:flagellar basal body-associated protein FliL